MTQTLEQPPASKPRLRRFVPALLTMSIGVALAIILYNLTRYSEQSRAQLEFSNLGDDIVNQVQTRMDAKHDALQAIGALYAASNSVDRNEFREFTAQTLIVQPSLKCLGWVPLVPAGEIDDFIRQARAELLMPEDFTIAPLPASTTQPAQRAPLTFVEPFDRYAKLRSIDLWQNPGCRQAMEAAIDAADLIASSRVTLDSPEAPEFDSIVFYPIFKRGMAVNTQEERRANIEGFAVGFLDLKTLSRRALEHLRLRGQDVRLIDNDDPKNPEIVYDSHSSDNADDKVEFSDWIKPWERHFALGDRDFILTGLPTRAYVANQRLWGPMALLVGGILFAGVASIYMHTLVSRAERIRQIVEQRTATLVAANARIAEESEHRRLTSEKLRDSEQRRRAIIQQASEGIYLVDAQTHRIIEANPAMARLLDYRIEEIVGQPIYQFVADTPESVAERIASVIHSTEPIVGERQYVKRNGTAIDISSSASVIQYGGRRVLCTVVHDITAVKKARLLMEEKNAQLEKSVEAERMALQQLQSTQSQLVQAEKLAGLGQMVAGVAHEINNPLSFVANNTAVVQRDLKSILQLLSLYQSADPLIAQHAGDLSAQIMDLSERIDLKYTSTNLADLLDRSREGLRRIQQIVKDLRDFARLDEGEVKEADLNAGIASTVNIIVGRAKKKQIIIDQELGQIPLIPCQAAKVNQVIMNLLSNAIDASPSGSKIVIRTERAGNEVLVRVIDQGSGIPPEVLPRIFDPFFTTKPLGQGTGLGLSISYGIIKDHHGRIEVQTEPGKGTTFTIRLPISRDS